MTVRAVAVCLAIGLLLVTNRAFARCDDAAHEWVRACALEQNITLSLSACPAGVAVLDARAPGGEPLRIELSHQPGAFVTVDGVGLAPIGDFADWKEEPAPTRRAFDAVQACVRLRPPNALLDGAGAVSATPTNTRAFPWLPILGVAAALASRVVRRCDRRRALLGVGVAIVGVVACFLARRWLVPLQFFHQNGQAPIWVDFAIRGDSAGYGPGYGEIFRPFVARASRPDLRLILVQELTSALVPLCAFFVARSVGARFGVAGLVFIGLSLDPLAMRLARSESYFATIFTLLMLAAAAASGPRRRVDARFVLAMISAGLFVAAAARVHPLAWVPAATIPLVVLAAPGPTVRRARHAVTAGAIIGVVVAIAALPAMRAVLGGELGSRFLPGALGEVRRGAWQIALAIAAGLALLAFRATRRMGGRALIVVVAATLAVVSNVVRIDIPMIGAAYLHLFLPAVLAGVAAIVALLPARASSIALVALIAFHFTRDRRVLLTPTDAREQAWCLAWRESLPPASSVQWLERAGTRVFSLPLAGVAAAAPFHAGITPRVVSAGPRFYYRSSLCSTPEGAPACAAFEQAHKLRSIERRTLPAIASQPWNPFAVDEVAVELFAVD